MRLIVCLLATALCAQVPLPSGGRARFSTTTSVVVVDVSVFGRDGKPIESLTRDDFTLLEDGKPQQLLSCDFQRLDSTPLPALPAATPRMQTTPPPTVQTPPADTELRDRRLIVLLFDFSSMQPPEQIRASKAALDFLSTRMTASDLMSVMTFGTNLRTVLNFTADRDAIASVIERFHIGESSELAGMADTGPDDEDQSGMFTADETEFNIFNADRKLAALQDAAERLRPYAQRKALVYFSSGLEKTGVDNQSQLRATVNAAVRSNVLFYPIDVRGLTASAPGGDATQAGAVGSKLYSGAAQSSMRSSFHNQQETLDTLAADTGGKALLDSNDLGLGIAQAQHDLRSYYILTYKSTNPAEDGRYRRIQVHLRASPETAKAKLEFRPGYYGPTSFSNMSASTREAQLVQAMASDNPPTDLPLAVEVDYFRLDKSRYFVPISARMPGSALAFHRKGSKQATELDFSAAVRDGRGQTVFTVRDAIPLKLEASTAAGVARKQIVYDTGGVLAPGSYTLRLIARENGEGKIGAFETRFDVPDLNSAKGLRTSSVVLSNQQQAISAVVGVKNKGSVLALNPLIDGSGRKLVPSVTKVFRPGQPLMVYVEVYDAAKSAETATRSLLANVALYRGDVKVLETSPVRSFPVNTKRAGAIPVKFEIPTKSLQPGRYDCQVNLIDEEGRKFAFPRMEVVFLAGAEPAQSASN